MRVLIIGLDCLDPHLAFERHADVMPNLTQLREQGAWGPLRSSDPPITVPAWSCMMSSRDPGQLGFYGFRNRKDHSYDGLSIAMGDSVDQPRLWNILEKNGKRSVVLAMPQTFPVPRKMNGLMVSGFLAPSVKSNFTCPPELKNELHELAGDGGYMIDVEQFRTEDKDRLLRDIYRLSRSRYRIVRQWIKTQQWDFFAFVDMGPDRLHHGFWRFGSPSHRFYDPKSPYESVIRDYYAFLDGEIGSLLELLDDDVAVMAVSDHGAQDMVGGICVNEWLQQKGWLTLKEKPQGVTRFTPDKVDWSKTKVWGEGGYYCRLFFNVKGREPNGQVDQADYERFRDEVQAELEGICDPEGNNIGTVVLRPEKIYRQVRNVAPDLMVYFGNLAWRSVGSVGMDGIHTFSNDTGPDDANHAQQGMFVLRDGKVSPGKREGTTLYDVAPTVLHRLGVAVPETMIGKVIE